MNGVGMSGGFFSGHIDLSDHSSYNKEIGKHYQIATILYEVLKTMVPPLKVETEEKGSSEIVFKAMGRAINKTITIVELIGVKKSLKMRHQPCSITSGTKCDGT
nr:DNA/RNA-binding protein Alba-like protein [Tanacetum cinerariifolium]